LRFDELRLDFSNAGDSAVADTKKTKAGHTRRTPEGNLALRMKEETSSKRGNDIHH